MAKIKFLIFNFLNSCAGLTLETADLSYMRWNSHSEKKTYRSDEIHLKELIAKNTREYGFLCFRIKHGVFFYDSFWGILSIK